MGVKAVVSLTPETAVPIFQLKDRLSIFENLDNPNAWTGHVRGSPVSKASDGEEGLEALMEAERNPIVRPVDEAKLRSRRRALKGKGGSFTVSEGEEPKKEDAKPSVVELAKETTAHTEVQWLLCSSWGTTWASTCGWPETTATGKRTVTGSWTYHA